MADNSNKRKKTLIVSVLAFLLIGGGVFLFFVIQGANDLTGANKNDKFHYGGAARQAATSFFKFIGFEEVETVANPPDNKRNKERSLILEKQDTAAASSGGGAGSDWGAPSAARHGAPSPAYVPKMASGGGSGVGGASAGGTKSSGGTARFSEGSDSGNTRITGKSLASAGGASSKGTLGALQNARAMLGDGLRSGSAMTAKGKWDASFGVGNAGAGGSSNLAYGKSGLVKLDAIKKGEIDNLKTTDTKSLKVPEPGAIKMDKADEAKETALAKVKDAAENAAKKNVAESLVSGAAGALWNSAGSPRAEDPQPPDELKKQADAMKLDSDSGVSFKAGSCDSTCPPEAAGKQIFSVTFSGTGTGNLPGNEGKPVDYKDTYDRAYLGADNKMHMIPDPPVISTMSEVVKK